MHEGTLVRELVAKVNAIAEAEGATSVSAVAVKVGDFSHVSADHLREHFAHEAAGTISEGARLDVEPVGGMDNPLALEIVLESIEIQQDDTGPVVQGFSSLPPAHETSVERDQTGTVVQGFSPLAAHETSVHRDDTSPVVQGFSPLAPAHETPVEQDDTGPVAQCLSVPSRKSWDVFKVDELVGAALVPAHDVPRNPLRDSWHNLRNEALSPSAPRNEPVTEPGGPNDG
jgi:hydrogenase nickel incorporation protein HypA/HybF